MAFVSSWTDVILCIFGTRLAPATVNKVLRAKSSRKLVLKELITGRIVLTEHDTANGIPVFTPQAHCFR